MFPYILGRFHLLLAVWKIHQYVRPHMQISPSERICGCPGGSFWNGESLCSWICSKAVHQSLMFSRKFYFATVPTQKLGLHWQEIKT